MVRDIESLIEFLYLKAIDSPLCQSDVVVNPLPTEVIISRSCIINSIYENDFSRFDVLVDRSKDFYEEFQNPLIGSLGIKSFNEILVHTDGKMFYFSYVPDEWTIHPCFKYLANQLGQATQLDYKLLTE